MALEVRELVIKASVGTNGAAQNSPAENSSSNLSNEHEIIKRCVEMVLEILKEKAER